MGGIALKNSEVLGIIVGDITNIFDKDGEDNTSSKIFDMLDLFYANKHMYEKLQSTYRKKQWDWE